MDETDENTDHRNRILAMVSKARTAESGQKLLAMQREVDAIISETLECYDDDAIEEEELAAFGLVLELFNHAIVERRAALQAGTLERLAARREATASRPYDALNSDVAVVHQAAKNALIDIDALDFIHAHFKGLPLDEASLVDYRMLVHRSRWSNDRRARRQRRRPEVLELRPRRHGVAAASSIGATTPATPKGK